jgi:cell division protein FtsI (penicillin-binding protein 3)
VTGPAAPEPGAEPRRGRFDDAPAPIARALVPTGAPEAQRRAVLETSRTRLVLGALGASAMFAALAVKLVDATLIAPVAPRPAVPIAGPPPPEQIASRAPILDRNGEVLAISLPVTGLAANPRLVEDAPALADRLLRVLPQLDRERVIERLTQDRSFVYLTRAITPREMQALNDIGSPALIFERGERRFHPQGRAAVHALGHADVDGRGVSGVEAWFDERLRTLRGEPLRMSLDVRVQLAVRDAVANAIREFNAIGGAGVVLDVRTGEVLAMVSLPDYDAADPGAATEDQRFNRITVGLYEPGSTFKLITAAAAIDAGSAQIWSGWDASRPITHGRFTISDFRGRNRWLTLPETIAYSSNIATARMALDLGVARHRDALDRAGLLSRLPIELAENEHPRAPRANAWREINTITISYGHGISVTPMHVATMAATVSNGGILRAPTLQAVPAGEPREGVRVFSERTSDIMRRLMRLAVTEGSGRSADVPGYFVGGKTGTAQKVGPRGGYLRDRRISAFVGAFPMHSPRYAIYVMVDEPRPNARSQGYATGGWVAAPAVGQIVARIGPILGLVPEDPNDRRLVALSTLPMQPRRGEALAGAGAPLPPAGPRPAVATQEVTPAARPAAAPRPLPPAALEPPRAPAAARVPSAEDPRAVPPATAEPRRLPPANAPRAAPPASSQPAAPAIRGPGAPGSLPPPVPLRLTALPDTPGPERSSRDAR